jgi:hypothetical protein
MCVPIVTLTSKKQKSKNLSRRCYCLVSRAKALSRPQSFLYASQMVVGDYVLTTGRLTTLQSRTSFRSLSLTNCLINFRGQWFSLNWICVPAITKSACTRTTFLRRRFGPTRAIMSSSSCLSASQMPHPLFKAL